MLTVLIEKAPKGSSASAVKFLINGNVVQTAKTAVPSKAFPVDFEIASGDKSGYLRGLTWGDGVKVIPPPSLVILPPSLVNNPPALVILPPSLVHNPPSLVNGRTTRT